LQPLFITHLIAQGFNLTVTLADAVPVSVVLVDVKPADVSVVAVGMLENRLNRLCVETVFPHILDMRFVVQLKNMADDSFVLQGFDLYREGFDVFAGMIVITPGVKGVGVTDVHIPFFKTPSAESAGQPQKMSAAAAVLRGSLQSCDVIFKIRLVMLRVVLHDFPQGVYHIHILKSHHRTHPVPLKARDHLHKNGCIPLSHIH